jgi:hypothetical protein
VWGPEPITFRRLAALVYGLPIESRLARDLGAPKPGDPVPIGVGWSNVEELLAAGIEATNRVGYYIVKANSRKGAHVQAPNPIPRPSRPGRHHRKQQTTAVELAAALGRGGNVRYTPKETP